MQVLRVEPTPNPNAIKFVLDAPAVSGPGVLEFKAAGEAVENELAHAIFEVGGVEELFFQANNITVTTAPTADWHLIDSRVKDIVSSSAGAPPAPAPAATPISDRIDGGDGELMQKIRTVLDERVMPALHADGGGMQVLGLSGKTLSIRYQGSCGSCPSAIAGTLQAIQQLLQNEVDPELSVVPG